MHWEAIGAIGQVVSALALVIVIVQIRHARSESRRVTSQRRAYALRDVNINTCEERISSIVTKAQTALGSAPTPLVATVIERAGLTREEAFVIGAWLVASWNYRIHIISNVEELSAMERTAFDRSIRQTYGKGALGRAFFETYLKPTQHPDAVRYGVNVLAEPG